MLYAWCRHCDDEIDGQTLGMGAVARPGTDPLVSLGRLREQTLLALAGESVTDPAFMALQRVAAGGVIEQEYALEFLAGFAMDVEGHQYQTLDATLLYCYRVAGVVGVMMASVMGVRDPQVLLRAADLGIAFQLTNISRDVLDDAANGRCYLPLDWLAEGQIPPDSLADENYRGSLTEVVGRLLAEADRYYESAYEGLRALDYRSGWAVVSALRVYQEIGHRVRRQGPAAWDSRARVGTGRKMLCLLSGALRAVQGVTADRWRRPRPRSADLRLPSPAWHAVLIQPIT